MFNQTVLGPEELPIQESKRQSTDVCCTIFSAVLALVLFILAIVFYSNTNLNNAYFNAADANGQSCALISYPDINNLSKGSCVTACPTGYSNNNGICWPNDQSAAAIYNSNPNLTSYGDYYGFRNSLVWTALLAFALGLLWLTFVQFFPKLAPAVSIALTVLTLVIIGILILVTHSSFFDSNSSWKYFLAIFAFILAIIIAVIGLVYSNQLRLTGIFLQYSRRFINQSVSNFIHIPLFLIFTLGLFALFIFQHAAFSSHSNSNHNFFDFSNPGFLGVLNILELIWGLRFLRDAFIYCVAGNSVDWYWNHQSTGAQPHWYSSLNRLLRKNWGSVVGGSFVNAFFEIPTLIIELFICHPGTCCSKLGNTCANTFSFIPFFLDLVRTDSYAYTSITGLPFCNSSRECAKIFNHNHSFVGSQNPVRSYRFVAHVLLVALTSVFGYAFANVRVVNISWWYIAVIITVSYGVVTWFIEIYGAAAQGISTSFETEHFASQDYQYMQRAIPSYRQEIEFRSSRVDSIRDGNI